MSVIDATTPRYPIPVGVPTSVPFTYRDSITTLQFIECLRHNLDALQRYVDQLKEWAQSEVGRTDARISEINAHLMSVDMQIEDILNKLGDMDITGDVYDVTQGRYVNSADAMRNMYRELAVFGARVAQIEHMTVEELATHTTDEVSAVGNLTIFNDATPRVTSVTTGLPYKEK